MSCLVGDLLAVKRLLHSLPVWLLVSNLLCLPGGKEEIVCPVALHRLQWFVLRVQRRLHAFLLLIVYHTHSKSLPSRIVCIIAVCLCIVAVCGHWLT